MLQDTSDGQIFYLNRDLSHFGDSIWYAKIWFKAPTIRFAIQFEILKIRFEKKLNCGKSQE